MDEVSKCAFIYVHVVIPDVKVGFRKLLLSGF